MNQETSFNIKALIARLKKDSKSIDDAKFIYNQVKDIQFFSNFFLLNYEELQIEGFYQLCRHFQYDFIPDNQIIVKKGSYTNGKLYIILQGQVALYSNEDGDTDRLDRLDPIDRILTVSDTIGQESFFNHTLKLQASYITKQPTHFLVIFRDSYQEVFKWYGKNWKQKINAITRILPCLDQLASKKMLDNLLYYFQDQKFFKGQTVYQLNKIQLYYIQREGTTSEFVYLLSDGECSVTKQYIKNIPVSNRQEWMEAVKSQRLDDEDLVPEEVKQRTVFISKLEGFVMIGDELIKEPDADQNQITPFEFSIKVISHFVQLYSIRVRLLERVFPSATIKQLINQAKNNQDKLTIRRKIYQQKIKEIENEKQFFNREKATFESLTRNNQNNEKVNEERQSSKDDLQFFRQFNHAVKNSLLKQRKKVEEIFESQNNNDFVIDNKEKEQQDRYYGDKQVPRRMEFKYKVLKKQEDHQKMRKEIHNKLSMVDFIRTNQSRAMLRKVENPYDFASNVNVDDFIKQYYSSLIHHGLVKPQNSKQIPDIDRLMKYRIQSSKCSSSHFANDIKLEIQSYNSSKVLSPTNSGPTPSVMFQDTQTKSQKDNFFISAYNLQTKDRIFSGKVLSIDIQTPTSIYQEQQKSRCHSSVSYRPKTSMIDNNLKINQKYEINKKLRKHSHFQEDITKIVERRKIIRVKMNSQLK